MLKRPSSRRKSKSEQVSLNLIPILDAMVTLIGFMLFTMSFLVLVSIETPFPESSPDINNQKFKDRPLQLTVSMHDKDVEIWSPFRRIEPKLIPNLAEGQPDVKAMHDALIAIKQQFPEENKLIFAPSKGATYEILIALMDAMRQLEPTDPPLTVKDSKTGVDHFMKQLFPDVIYGNLLSTN